MPVRIALVASLLALSLVAACDHGPEIGANPTPTSTPYQRPEGQLPPLCDDGRRARPGEACP